MTAFEFSAAPVRRKFSGSVTIALVAAVAAATLARFNADSFYYGDLLTFFLPALFGVSVAAALVALVAGHRILAAIALVLAVLNGLPLFTPVERAAASAGGRELRVATSNVLGGRSDFDDLIAWSTRSGIDLLGQQEVSGYVLRHFDALRSHFPSTPPAELLGRHPEVMAWSGWKILKAEHVRNIPVVPGLGWGGSPLRLELAPPDTTNAASPDAPALVVYVLHPTTPRSFDQWQSRNAYLDAIARSIAAEAPGTPIVAMGDFNTPTWSPFFQSFLKTSGLVDAAGTGWPSTTRFSRRWLVKRFYVGSPVDHILVSPNIEVKRFEVGPDIGSDHLPVIADLRLP
ncbi:putative Endonuclease/exonuclease/phosphatase [uncultured Pleomorphomonas sp.]|uniref:Putative Endonuclease/exonuclease/phosphatase n=1 Tax=uncultured Pleomorphomonas sp. TaxID=442121 RepID=A0A212LAU4_9HYPH|nr:endonuclease/exonuclease/phosphatase family protein [uncultured Pleomorphomonas sp.]SCM74628.1 putative Endonuclease/exonuclease/phosphatase [uncultured Pleomorphomonas sp.]